MTQKQKNNDNPFTAPADEPGITSSGLGAPPVSSGKKIINRLPDDDATTENTVEQGVADAENDSADKAAKESTRNKD